MLPDTFGTTQFLEGAPDWVADWTGQRCDSKDPFVAGDEYIAWLLRRGRDARRKRLIASDGLDVDEILRLHEYFHGRIRFSAGWGTLLTNDFRGCHPRGETTLDPISLVCKLMTVEGKAGGEAVGQCAEGDRAGGGDCAVSEGVWECGGGGARSVTV